MFVFGLDLPLAEIIFIMILFFMICLILVLRQLQKLQRMTSEEQSELAELEKLAQEEKHDLEQIKTFETAESVDLGKFEKDISTLEEQTDTMYIKKLAPDVYKVQNYVLWGLQKGMSPEQIKQNLLNKGWKDNKLIEMVVDDILKYKGYYVENKGKVEIPQLKTELKTEAKPDDEKVRIVKIVEQPVIMPTRTSIIREKHIIKEKPAKKHKKAKHQKKSSYYSVEKEISKLEKDLKKEAKPRTKSKPKKPKKTEKKRPAKKASKVKKPRMYKKPQVEVPRKEGTVTLHADKNVDVHVKYD